MENNNNFQRVLDISERTTDALSNFINKFEDQDKKIEWVAQELKELNKILIKKPCMTETIPWANLETNVKQEWEKRVKEHDDLKTTIEDLKSNIKTMIDKMNERIEKDKNITFWLKALAGIIALAGVIIGILVKL